jgi:hypothetical protein
MLITYDTFSGRTRHRRERFLGEGSRNRLFQLTRHDKYRSVSSLKQLAKVSLLLLRFIGYPSLHPHNYYEEI